MLIKRIKRDRRRESGAALAEYGMLVAGIVLVCMVAVSVLGTKIGGMIGAVATLLPSAYNDMNAPVQVGQVIETKTIDTNGDGVKEIVMNAAGITDNNALAGDEPATPRLGQSLGLDGHDTSHLYQLGTQSNPFH